MSRQPYRENIDVCSDSDVRWLCCSRCTRILCRLDQDWRAAEQKKTLSAESGWPFDESPQWTLCFRKTLLPLMRRIV